MNEEHLLKILRIFRPREEWRARLAAQKKYRESKPYYKKILQDGASRIRETGLNIYVYSLLLQIWPRL